MVAFLRELNYKMLGNMLWSASVGCSLAIKPQQSLCSGLHGFPGGFPMNELSIWKYSIPQILQPISSSAI